MTNSKQDAALRCFDRAATIALAISIALAIGSLIASAL